MLEHSSSECNEMHATNQTCHTATILKIIAHQQLFGEVGIVMHFRLSDPIGQ